MNHTKSNASKVNWVRTGPENASTVLLIHAVGYDLTYWGKQIEALQSTYNVVAFDLPGHGRSTGGSQDCSLDQMVTAVADLIDMTGGCPVHLVGISFGGMIAQATALSKPELVRSLTLIATASTFPESARAVMRSRAEAVRKDGMEAVIQSSLERWFTPETRVRRPDLMDRITKTLLADDPSVHAAIWETIAKFDVHDQLGKIKCPTLILVGDRDPSTPPNAARALAESIEGARLVVLSDASHMVTLELPDAVNSELRKFLSAI